VLRNLQLFNATLILSAVGWLLVNAIDRPWQMHVVLIGGALVGIVCASWGSTNASAQRLPVLEIMRAWWQHLWQLCLFTYLASAVLGLIFIGLPILFGQSLENYNFCATQTPTGDEVCENDY